MKKKKKKNVFLHNRTGRVVQSKVNSSLVSTYNCEMGFCLCLCSGDKGMFSFADIL